MSIPPRDIWAVRTVFLLRTFTILDCGTEIERNVVAKLIDSSFSVDWYEAWRKVGQRGFKVLTRKLTLLAGS